MKSKKKSNTGNTANTHVQAVNHDLLRQPACDIVEEQKKKRTVLSYLSWSGELASYIDWI